jgi:hypothetical protein
MTFKAAGFRQGVLLLRVALSVIDRFGDEAMRVFKPA